MLQVLLYLKKDFQDVVLYLWQSMNWAAVKTTDIRVIEKENIGI